MATCGLCLEFKFNIRGVHHSKKEGLHSKQAPCTNALQQHSFLFHSPLQQPPLEAVTAAGHNLCVCSSTLYAWAGVWRGCICGK